MCSLSRPQIVGRSLKITLILKEIQSSMCLSVASWHRPFNNIPNLTLPPTWSLFQIELELYSQLILCFVRLKNNAYIASSVHMQTPYETSLCQLALGLFNLRSWWGGGRNGKFRGPPPHIFLFFRRPPLTYFFFFSGTPPHIFSFFRGPPLTYFYLIFHSAPTSGSQME